MLNGKNREKVSILSLLGVLLLRVDSGSVYFRSEKISEYTSDYESQVCGRRKSPVNECECVHVHTHSNTSPVVV